MRHAKRDRRKQPAFTLVELILVMAILAGILAISAPSLSRSFRQRNLEQEGTRFVALTEYARNEAVSQGVPVVIWIDPEAGRFGCGPRTGFTGVNRREFKLGSDARFELDNLGFGQSASEVIEFAPDGVPEPSSLDTVRLAGPSNSVVLIAKTESGWGYELVKEKQ